MNKRKRLVETFIESILEERQCPVVWGERKIWKGAGLLGVTPLNTKFSSKMLMINM